VPDVARRHDVNAISDARGTAGLLGDGAVNGRAFADNAVVADDRFGAGAVVFGVLRRQADEGAWADFAASADGGDAVDVATFLNDGAGPDGDAGFDNAVGPNRNISGEFCPAVDNCCWVNICHTGK
jgi:hypothetical protein